MKIPITQSKAWQNLQTDLKEESFLESKPDFHYLAIKKTTPAGNYLYLPYGPVVETKTGLKNALESLDSLAKKKSAISIRIEPMSPEIVEFLPQNAKKVKDLNPKETWVLDLTGSDEDLKSKLPSRLLRYYKNMSKNGLTIEKTTDPEKIKHLLALQKSLAKEKGINTFSETYLKTELSQPFATLYLLKRSPETLSGAQETPQKDSPEILAAGLVFDDETTRYNLQGAQSETGRKLHATGILTIQLILDAKEKGLKTFDFWGIAPDGAPENHPWAGFTNFKKTFAGHEVRYAGTYDIIKNPLKYHLYNLLRKLNRFLRG